MYLTQKMENLHNQICAFDQIKGSLLLRENGSYISSKIPSEIPEGHQLAPHIAHIFQYFHELSGIEEFTFKFKGTHLHLKHIPSKGMILTAFTDTLSAPKLQEIINRYAVEFEYLI